MGIVDCAIVGAGPAGLACALQASRQGRTVALFEKARAGGQALAANLIENYPGFPEGITGRQLMAKFLVQIGTCGIKVRHEEVKRVTYSERRFLITTDAGQTSSLTLVAASGLVPNRLGVPGEDELAGKRIFYYPDPHEIPHKGKDVLIIGAGDAAFDQALSFAQKAKSITIAMKYDVPRCAPPLADKVRHAGVKILPSSRISAVSKAHDRIKIQFTGDSDIQADILIACIGKKKCFDFLDRNVLEAAGKGIFFAGDCIRDRDRHISIAVGDGVAAAMAVEEYLVCGAWN